MSGMRRVRRSRRNRSVRWIVVAVILCSGASCLAPALVASTDCSRWLAEYRQGILQRRAARRLRATKYRLVTLVHKPAPPHAHPLRHRMGPLESLRRFQIDCGDLAPPESPLEEAIVPPQPVPPAVTFVSLLEAPPDLPPPSQPALSVVPPLADVPAIPVETPPILAATIVPSATPEPGSWILVLTGAGAVAELVRRRRRQQMVKAVA